MDLSIVIPMFNSKQFIKESIDSITRQDYSNLSIELILVDDGSTDDGLYYVQNLLKDHNFKSIYLHQKNSGVSKARNNGLLHSTGKYICFLDSDDMFNDSFFKTIKNHLEQDLDIIFWPYQRITEKNEIKYSENTPTHHHQNYTSKGIKILEEIMINKNHWICTGSILFLRNFLLENELQYDFRFSNGEDQLFHFKALLLAEKVLYIDKVLTTILLRGNSVSRQFKITHIENVLALNNIRILIKERYKDNKDILYHINEHILQNFLLFYNKGIKFNNMVSIVRIKKQLNNLYPSLKIVLNDIYKEYSEQTDKLNFKYFVAVKCLVLYGFIYKISLVVHKKQ